MLLPSDSAKVAVSLTGPSVKEITLPVDTKEYHHTNTCHNK